MFEEDRVVHVGSGWSGTADRVIDGKEICVLPRLVNVHGHIGTEPLGKGFFEELGSPLMYMSRLYEFIYVVRPEPETLPASTQLSIAEILTSGCTTVADMGHPRDDDSR